MWKRSIEKKQQPSLQTEGEKIDSNFYGNCLVVFILPYLETYTYCIWSYIWRWLLPWLDPFYQTLVSCFDCTKFQPQFSHLYFALRKKKSMPTCIKSTKIFENISTFWNIHVSLFLKDRLRFYIHLGFMDNFFSETYKNFMDFLQTLSVIALHIDINRDCTAS